MIRQALKAWRTATKNLLTATKEVDEEQRDASIATIEKLLDEREQLKGGIVAPFTKEEEALGQELVRLEQELQTKLALFTKRIRTDILQAQSKKTHMKEYVNPYGHVGRDGTYYDTKQ